jgi:cellulose synthase/poly-beta-1,6-N-acetylglucosamine synthase-like glycosyltransferase
MEMLDIVCCLLSVVFFWSTLILLLGLLKSPRRHPHASGKLRFAVLICARNEESVIRLPVKSLELSKYPSDRRDVIVLADNCTDRTAEVAWAAGATVWEKTTPSSGKGDVLAWGVERVIAHGGFDAIAVFDSDNIVADNWLDAVNDALQDGESVVTGCRHSSNARANSISGWYTVYWDIMNELSNRVRTNLGLSGKLTGTGFAFLLSALGPGGWQTRTMVEDVEFTVQMNIAGRRVAYVPEADYADEQPMTASSMWRQLRRWATGGWQVARFYMLPWLFALLRRPSLRLFDSYFAILTGMSVAFVLFFDVAAFIAKLCRGDDGVAAYSFFFGVIGFVFAMGWFTALAAIGLSKKKRRPEWKAILTFPIFSLVISASILCTLVAPTRRWKPIPHSGLASD